MDVAPLSISVYKKKKDEQEIKKDGAIKGKLKNKI